LTADTSTDLSSPPPDMISRLPSAAPVVHSRFQPLKSEDATSQAQQWADDAGRQALAARSPGAVLCRARILQVFNTLVTTWLPYVTAGDLTTNPLTAKLILNKGLVFDTTVNDLIHPALLEILSSGDIPEVSLNKFSASSQSFGASITWQIFKALETKPLTNYKSHGKTRMLWKVNMVGLGSTDQGGPFRSSIQDMCNELMSHVTPLFVPVPNAMAAGGLQNRDTWVPNPKATSPLHLRLYRFLGRLMASTPGLTNFKLPLRLPGFFWKQFVWQHADIRDLASIDEAIVHSLEVIRTCATEADWAAVAPKRWEVRSADGRSVVFRQGPGPTFAERASYVQQAIALRLEEMERQIAAVREGFTTQCPKVQSLLPFVTWRSMQTLICGSDAVDINFLKQIANYSGGSATSPHYAMFWRVMETLGDEDRGNFVAFTYGVSRLPDDPSRVQLNMQATDSKSDTVLPTSGTCGFSFTLPRYSTEAIMRDKLLYAIRNCGAIDSDFAARGTFSEAGEAAVEFGESTSLGGLVARPAFHYPPRTRAVVAPGPPIE